MSADERIVAFFEHMLGYTDEEFERWKAVPRNVRSVENMADLVKYKLVVEALRS